MFQDRFRIWVVKKENAKKKVIFGAKKKGRAAGPIYEKYRAPPTKCRSCTDRPLRFRTLFRSAKYYEGAILQKWIFAPDVERFKRISIPRGIWGRFDKGDLDKRTSFYTEKKAISRIQNDERRPITELQTLRKCGARKSLPASIGGWLLFCTLSRFQSRHRGKLTYWGTQLWNLSGIVRWLIPAVKCCEARAQNKIGVIPGKFHFGRTCEGVRSKLTECRAQFRTQNMAKNRRPTMRGVHTSNPRELKIETFR